MNYACTYLGEWEQELFEKSDRLPTWKEISLDKSVFYFNIDI
jgi:hypothetical protein